MKQFKVGDLVEYKYVPAPRRWGRCPGLIVGFEAPVQGLIGPDLSPLSLRARVLWSGRSSTMLVSVTRLNRFDPQSTKEYNAN